jgi:hypothetical protein
MAAKKGKLFADVMFPIQIVRALRLLGYHVRTAQQHEGTSRPAEPMTDEEVLDAAINFRGAVLTLNDADFLGLNRVRHHTHKGIIICKHTREHEKRAKEIDNIIQNSRPLVGKVIFVPPKPAEV